MRKIKHKAPNVPAEEQCHSDAFVGIDLNDGGSEVVGEIFFKNHLLVPKAYLASLKRELNKAATQRTLKLAEQSEPLYVALKAMADLLNAVAEGSFAVGSPDWIANVNQELERADALLKETLAIAEGRS